MVLSITTITDDLLYIVEGKIYIQTAHIVVHCKMNLLWRDEGSVFCFCGTGSLEKNYNTNIIFTKLEYFVECMYGSLLVQ